MWKCKNVVLYTISSQFYLKFACSTGFISSLETPSEQQLVLSKSNDDDFAL
jgi:hypothetical protein